MKSGKEDSPIIWDIRYCDLPAVLRYCKKCRKKSEYICSGEFRVNAQQKVLDILLIYKCAYLLERFSCNEKNWRCSIRWMFLFYIETVQKTKYRPFKLLGKRFL